LSLNRPVVSVGVGLLAGWLAGWLALTLRKYPCISVEPSLSGCGRVMQAAAATRVKQIMATGGLDTTTKQKIVLSTRHLQCCALGCPPGWLGGEQRPSCLPPACCWGADQLKSTLSANHTTLYGGHSFDLGCTVPQENTTMGPPRGEGPPCSAADLRPPPPLLKQMLDHGMHALGAAHATN